MTVGGQRQRERAAPRVLVMVMVCALCASLAASCRSNTSSDRAASPRPKAGQTRPPVANSDSDRATESNSGGAEPSTDSESDGAGLPESAGPPDRGAPQDGGGAQPASLPTREGCSAVVTAPASLQDAIDAVSDHTSPFVLCLEGTFVGGGAPVSEDRPGIGPYYGGVVIKDRTDFTLRGLPGSSIVGVHNDRVYPDEDAPPEAQGANDKGNLVKVVDSTRVTLEWLTVDGRVPDPASPDGRGTLNRLVWLQHTTATVVRYNTIQHAGGECVRVKANAQHNEIHHNFIGDCGYFQFKVQKDTRLQKNGEAVYVGTDPAQIADTQVNKQRYWGLDPSLVTDRSSFNSIHHNVLRPGPQGADWGNECVDLKEDWSRVRAELAGDAERGEPGHNVVADNDCAGQFDPESGAFDSRGPDNVFEHNLVSGTVKGAAIRVGAKEKDVGDAGTVDWQAVRNVVRLNRLESFGYRTALKVFDDQELAEVCGNVDRHGRTDFGGKFSNEPDVASNRARCGASRVAAGPRGPVGVPTVNG